MDLYLAQQLPESADALSDRLRSHDPEIIEEEAFSIRQWQSLVRENFALDCRVLLAHSRLVAPRVSPTSSESPAKPRAFPLAPHTPQAFLANVGHLEAPRSGTIILIASQKLLVNQVFLGQAVKLCQRGATFVPPPAPDYSTGFHVVRYQERLAAWLLNIESERIETDLSKENLVELLESVAGLCLPSSLVDALPPLTWAQTCRQLAQLVVGGSVGSLRLSLHAAWYAHDFADYQRHARSEMLDLVPQGLGPGSLLPTGLDRWLDVGGGEGAFLQALAKHPHAPKERWLCEPSAAALMARDASLAHDPSIAHDASTNAACNRIEPIQVVQASLEAALESGALQRASFDAVSLLDVLEHTDHPQKTLAMVHALLRPKGFVLLSVPNANFWQCREAMLHGAFAYTPVGPWCITHRHFFSAESLKALLEAQGFRILKWTSARQPVAPDFAAILRQTGLDPHSEALEAIAFHVLAQALH